jgi:hypothetical protein
MVRGKCCHALLASPSERQLLFASLLLPRRTHAHCQPFHGFADFTFTPVSMAGDAPHGGEMHPDGDEILYVVAPIEIVTLSTGPKLEFRAPR